MATVQRLTYGPGGLDRSKPANNVTETTGETVADLPPGVAGALAVIRNRVTGQGTQPTDTQVINALAAVTARLLVPDALNP